jgi:hypothetical protein
LSGNKCGPGLSAKFIQTHILARRDTLHKKSILSVF